MAIKALLVHHAKDGGNSQEDVGWGRFPQSLNEITLCEDHEATVIYQGFLSQSEYLRAAIPYPDIKISKKVSIKATFCFSAATDPEHPVLP